MGDDSPSDSERCPKYGVENEDWISPLVDPNDDPSPPGSIRVQAIRIAHIRVHHVSLVESDYEEAFG